LIVTRCSDLTISIASVAPVGQGTAAKVSIFRG
jgi:hypothetical protein